MRHDASEDCRPEAAHRPFTHVGSDEPAEATSTQRARDAALRLCVTMTLLPRAPAKISARALAERLAEAGWEVTVRTVERDLHRLRSVFPIALDDEHKPFGWSLVGEPTLSRAEP